MVNGADTIGTEVLIGNDGGNVVLHFKVPRFDWIMGPENARHIGVGILKASFTARYGREPGSGDLAYVGQEMRSKATELMRTKLTNRAAIVMRSLYENKWTPAQAAKELVDIMMKELT